MADIQNNVTGMQNNGAYNMMGNMQAMNMPGSMAGSMPGNMQAANMPVVNNEQNPNRLTMEEMLTADFGEKSCKIVASFKKTIQIEQYNPEVVQIDAECEFDGHMTNAERDVIASMLQNSIEYQVQSHLLMKNLISMPEFQDRKRKLEASCDTIMRKFESVTGRSRYEILNRAANQNKTSSE